MFYNYLKIAIRNLFRHRLFSGINIAGLAASMSLGLIMIAMVSDLFQYDEFHDKKDRIYRVISHVQHGQRYNDQASTVVPLAEQARNLDNNVESVVRVRRYFGGEVEANGKKITLNGHFADPDFLQIFSFPMLYGSAEKALQDPFSVVITRKTMDKVFDGRNPVGKEMEVEGLGLFQVSGVVEDIPRASHLQFDMLGSFSTVAALERQELIVPSLESWTAFQMNYLYLLLKPGQSPDQVAQALNSTATPVYADMPEMAATFSLQALPAIVPGMSLSDQIGPKMEPVALLILSILSLAVLLSACFNYTNLSLARAIRRSKEIGVRKVAGASRGQIVRQFLVEAVVVSLLALGMAIGIFTVIRPGFLQVVPRASEMMTMELTPLVLLGFVCFALLAGVLAGIVPALVLSRLNPAQMVKNWSSGGLLSRISLRKALVVFQFTISLAFLIAATIAYRQYKFALHHDLGFDKANILNVQLQGADPNIVGSAMASVPGVEGISFSSLVSATGSRSADWVRTEEMTDSLGMYYMSVDANFLPNHKLPLVCGENFPEDLPDAGEKFVLLNEQAAKTLQWEPTEALGQIVHVNGQPLRVQGVVKDFHYTHLEEPITNFFFRQNPAIYNYANVKISSADVPATMAALDRRWQELDTGRDFEAQFFDAQIEEAYGFLINSVKIFGYLAFTAIAIACLGLLGMAVYTIETRKKEVGIRKVFGASAWQLVKLLSMGFVRMLVIAALIALPLMYLLFDTVVLNQFVYRISIGIVELGTGLALLFLLGLLVIGTQTRKAALANPMEALQGE